MEGLLPHGVQVYAREAQLAWLAGSWFRVRGVVLECVELGGALGYSAAAGLGYAMLQARLYHTLAIHHHQ